MQSAPLSQERWKRLHEDRQRRSGSRSSRIQAAIRRMASEEPGPGQQYALQARKHIATLRRARPDITVELQWCPAHKGVTGNEKAAAEEPDARGVEWLRYLDRAEVRAMPLPMSRAPKAGDLREEVGGVGRKARWLGVPRGLPHGATR